MKKQITMRSLFMIALFALMSFSGYSQVAVAVKQDSTISNVKRIRASVDTSSAIGTRSRVRIDTTNAKLALIKTASYSNSVSLTAIDKGVDTTNQSLRAIMVNTDSNSVYSSRGVTKLTSIKSTNDTLAQTLRTISSMSNTGGYSTKLSNTITTDAVAYSSGDNIGGINTMTNALRTTAGTGVLNDFQVWSKEGQTFNATIDFWSASPSGTYTNNSAEVIAGDNAVWLGSITILTTDFITTGAISRAHIKNIGIKLGNQAAKNIFFTIVTTSTPTWAVGVEGVYTVAGITQD